jgi:hypothetical protein
MSFFKKTTLALALVAASAMGTPALAAMQTVDAVGYTFSFDDVLWGVPLGTSFSSAGDVFTFADLGYATSDAVAKRGQSYSTVNDWLYSAVTVTAKSGYQIAGITTLATGQVSATAGADALATAYADVAFSTSWSTDTGEGHKPSGYSAAGVYAEPGTSALLAYSVTDTAVFSSGPMSAVGTSDVYVSTFAALAGSAANASLNTASFSVAVTPVPEPETYAMLLAGLGLIGTIARRRKQKSAA